MKIEANMKKRVNGETLKEFISGVALIQGGTQAVDFTINDTEACPDQVAVLSAITDSFRAKRLIPVLEITGGEIGKVQTVAANGSTPAHAKTWAGKPVHQLTGNFTWDVVDAVALPPIPQGVMAPTALEKATDILKRF